MADLKRRKTSALMFKLMLVGFFELTLERQGDAGEWIILFMGLQDLFGVSSSDLAWFFSLYRCGGPLVLG